MAAVNLDKEGEIVVGFVSQDKTIAASGVAMTVTFKLKDSSAVAELPISLVVDEWTTADGNAVEEAPIKVDGAIKIAEATTTEAPTTTEAAATTTEAATTTTIPDTATGETTPWALLTVTALAGAALVGLTMKRK